ERRADAGQRIDLPPDQRAVAQTQMRLNIDAVEQRPRLGRVEHRRLPAGHDVRRPAYRVRRIDRHDLAVSQSNTWRSAASRCLTEAAASSRVGASIHVATCTG